jgi:excisionase family DNA binding protein
MLKSNCIGPDERRAYRVKEFCHLYGVSHAHVYKLARTGRLRMVKVGGRTLIRREDAEALLREGAQQ